MPTFRLKSDGREYTTRDPAEATRYRMSRQYEEVGVATPPTITETQFHPGGKKVAEVMTYLQENPEDAARVIAEEKGGENRPTIVSFEG